jgi:hypothetical protein
MFQQSESNIYHDRTPLILQGGKEQKDHTPLIKRWGLSKKQTIQTSYMNMVLNPGEALLTCTVSHFGQGKGIRRVAVVLNYVEKG